MLGRGLQGPQNNQAAGLMNGFVNVGLTQIMWLVPLNKELEQGNDCQSEGDLNIQASETSPCKKENQKSKLIIYSLSIRWLFSKTVEPH